MPATTTAIAHDLHAARGRLALVLRTIDAEGALRGLSEPEQHGVFSALVDVDRALRAAAEHVGREATT
jgi:hypothetical protein